MAEWSNTSYAVTSEDGEALRRVYEDLRSLEVPNPLHISFPDQMRTFIPGIRLADWYGYCDGGGDLFSRGDCIGNLSLDPSGRRLLFDHLNNFSGSDILDFLKDEYRFSGTAVVTGSYGSNGAVRHDARRTFSFDGTSGSPIGKRAFSHPYLLFNSLALSRERSGWRENVLLEAVRMQVADNFPVCSEPDMRSWLDSWVESRRCGSVPDMKDQVSRQFASDMADVISSLRGIRNKPVMDAYFNCYAVLWYRNLGFDDSRIVRGLEDVFSVYSSALLSGVTALLRRNDREAASVLSVILDTAPAPKPEQTQEKESRMGLGGMKI